MSELLRPEPPRSLGERLASVRATVNPLRAAASAGLIVVVLTGAWWLLRPGPAPVEATLPMAATGGAATTNAAGASGGASGAADPVDAAGPAPPPAVVEVELVVQVAGAVAAPGVYRLGEGSRVIELVEAAGGPTADADLEAVALAALLVDGQRIQVPRQGEVLPDTVTGRSPPVAGAAGTGPPAPIDLNTATLEQLDTLPGVGPATAQAIVGFRERQGPFASVEDLTEVQGIGPARLEALRELVTV